MFGPKHVFFTIRDGWVSGGETVFDIRFDRKLSWQFSRFRFPFNLFKLRIKRLRSTTWHELHSVPIEIPQAALWETEIHWIYIYCIETSYSWERNHRILAACKHFFSPNKIMNKKCEFSHFHYALDGLFCGLYSKRRFHFARENVF